MDSNENRLLGLHRAEFERAKIFRKYSLFAQIMVPLFGLISVFIQDATVIYLSTLFALIAVCLSVLFSLLSRYSRDNAERGRRVLLLMRGLGWKMSPKQITDLISTFSIPATKAEQWQDEDYFSSVEHPGPKALAKLIEENAFWSRHLFKVAARRYWKYSSLLIVPILIIFVAIGCAPTQLITIARIVCLILMSFVAVDFIGTALAFTNAANLIAHIDEKIENIIALGCNLLDVIYVYDEYNAIVQRIPMIPTDVYSKHHNKINELWKERAID